MEKLGIIGCGVMVSAIASAASCTVIGYDHDKSKVEALGITVADSIDDLLEQADVILLAVKPQDFHEMLIDFGDKLVISIMAGVKLADLGGERAIRVMPNLGAKVGKSVSAWACSDSVTEEDKNFVRELLLSFGVEVEVKSDDDIFKMTALTGSGPAYLYAFLKAMREVGEEFGFSEDVLDTVLPALVEGAMKAQEGSYDDMTSKVASKGGTTEAALNVLGDEWGGKLKEAVKAAYDRAKEL